MCASDVSLAGDVARDETALQPAGGGARERIVAFIEDEIAQGRLQPGEKAPSRVELARRFQVSSQTVTTAIRDLSRRGVVAHVAGKGVFVAESRQPAPQNVLTIGIIGWYASHLDYTQGGAPGIGGYWGGAFRAISRFTHEAGYGLLLIPQTDQEPLDVDRIMAHNPNLIISVGVQLRPETVYEFRRRGVQLLLGNRHLDSLGVSYVDFDTEGDFRRMVRIFHDRGHRRIGAILQEMRIPEIQNHCFEAFCSELAMRDCVYPYRQYWRSFPRSEGVSHSHEELRARGHAEMEAFLELPEPPTAIYSRIGTVLEGAEQALRERGLAVGRDVSFLGESNGEESLPWSLFQVPQEEMGKETVGAIQKMIADPHRVYQVDVPKTFVDKGSIAHLT